MLTPHHLNLEQWEHQSVAAVGMGSAGMYAMVVVLVIVIVVVVV